MGARNFAIGLFAAFLFGCVSGPTTFSEPEPEQAAEGRRDGSGSTEVGQDCPVWDGWHLGNYTTGVYAPPGRTQFCRKPSGTTPFEVVLTLTNRSSVRFAAPVYVSEPGRVIALLPQVLNATLSTGGVGGDTWVLGPGTHTFTVENPCSKETCLDSNPDGSYPGVWSRGYAYIVTTPVSTERTPPPLRINCRSQIFASQLPPSLGHYEWFTPVLGDSEDGSFDVALDLMVFSDEREFDVLRYEPDHDAWVSADSAYSPGGLRRFRALEGRHYAIVVRGSPGQLLTLQDDAPEYRRINELCPNAL